MIFPINVQHLLNRYLPAFLFYIFFNSNLVCGELKERLFELAQKTQFQVDKIYTIDESKRSAHSNVFFMGIGRFRHVVVYDTLFHQLLMDEIASVLVHENGHYKFY